MYAEVVDIELYTLTRVAALACDRVVFGFAFLDAPVIFFEYLSLRELRNVRSVVYGAFLI